MAGITEAERELREHPQSASTGQSVALSFFSFFFLSFLATVPPFSPCALHGLVAARLGALV